MNLNNLPDTVFNCLLLLNTNGWIEVSSSHLTELSSICAEVIKNKANSLLNAFHDVPPNAIATNDEKNVVPIFGFSWKGHIKRAVTIGNFHLWPPERWLVHTVSHSALVCTTTVGRTATKSTAAAAGRQGQSSTVHKTRQSGYYHHRLAVKQPSTYQHRSPKFAPPCQSYHFSDSVSNRNPSRSCPATWSLISGTNPTNTPMTWNRRTHCNNL